MLTQAQADEVLLIYQAGGYDTEALAYLLAEGLDLDALERLEAIPEGQKLLGKGRVLAKAYWEKMLRTNIGNRHFNLPAWYAAVKPKWTEYRDDTPKIAIQNNTITANNERVQAVIDNLMARMKPAQGLTLGAESGENTRVIDATPEELPR